MFVDFGLLAELVVGPATSGRTRWIAPGMTVPPPVAKLVRNRAGLLAKEAREMRRIGECQVLDDVLNRPPSKYQLALDFGAHPLADEGDRR